MAVMSTTSVAQYLTLLSNHDRPPPPQAEPCIRSEQSTIEEYLMLSTVASEISVDLLGYAIR